MSCNGAITSSSRDPFWLERSAVFWPMGSRIWTVSKGTQGGVGKHSDGLCLVLVDAHGTCRIFIIEGVLTAICAIAGKFLIVDWPETAKFLTEDEKRLLVARLSSDVADAKMNRLDRPAYKRIFGDWKIYCGILMYFGIVNTGYATSVSVQRYRRHSAQLTNALSVLHPDHSNTTQL